MSKRKRTSPTKPASTARPHPKADATAAAPVAALERDGRIVAIDILRGVAILWVICFHLWTDMTLKFGPTEPLYVALRERLSEGQPLPALTAFTDVLLGTGFHGVSLFMMLSGLSLTLNSYRRAEPSFLRGFLMRARRLIPAYWGGIAVILGTIFSVALIQTWLHGTSLGYEWNHVTTGVIGVIHVRPFDVVTAASVFGWLFADRLNNTLVGSMWFIALIFQYYLVFPLLLRLLHRIGPMWLLVFGVVVTLTCRAVLIWVGWEPLGDTMGVVINSWAPFRLAEFTTGMTIGWLLVHRREEVGEWVRSPFDIVGLVVIALLLQMAGAVLGPKAQMLQVVEQPLIALGMTVYALPVLFKVPGRLEVSLPARALVFMGVISFPVLIINDAMRLVASLLRIEGVPDPLWWFFLVVIYVPVGVIIAYGYALLFGLVPKQRKPRVAGVAQPTPSVDMDLQPASGGR